MNQAYKYPKTMIFDKETEVCLYSELHKSADILILDLDKIIKDKTPDSSQYNYFELKKEILNYGAMTTNSILYYNGDIEEVFQLESGTSFKSPSPETTLDWVKVKLIEIANSRLSEFSSRQRSELRDSIEFHLSKIRADRIRITPTPEFVRYSKHAAEINDIVTDWELQLLNYESGTVTKDLLVHQYVNMIYPRVYMFKNEVINIVDDIQILIKQEIETQDTTQVQTKP